MFLSSACWILFGDLSFSSLVWTLNYSFWTSDESSSLLERTLFNDSLNKNFWHSLWFRFRRPSLRASIHLFFSRFLLFSSLPWANDLWTRIGCLLFQLLISGANLRVDRTGQEKAPKNFNQKRKECKTRPIGCAVQQSTRTFIHNPEINWGLRIILSLKTKRPEIDFFSISLFCFVDKKRNYKFFISRRKATFDRSWKWKFIKVCESQIAMKCALRFLSVAEIL